MLSKLRPRLSYANVVSTVCLFVLLGGSAVAATVITGKDVKNGSLTGKDVKNKSLTGKDVKNSSLTGADLRSESVNSDDVQNGSLLGQDFAPGQLPQGPQGPKGDTGPKGDPGTDASINGVAAGGVLSGTYPNPSIADGAVTSAMLAASEGWHEVGAQGEPAFEHIGYTATQTHLLAGEAKKTCKSQLF